MQQIENVTFLKKEVKSTMSELIKAIDAESMKTDLPAFNVGDTVKVGYKIIEGGKERIQNFEVFCLLSARAVLTVSALIRTLPGVFRPSK